MSNKKPNLFNFFFYLFPILIGPLYILEIRNKNKKLPIILVSFFIGLFSFLYVPSITNDKFYYFELYQDFQNYGFRYYKNYIMFRPDIVFYSLIYLFSLLGLSFKFLSGFLGGFIFYFTSTSIGLNSIKDKNKYTFVLILLILGISFPDYYSGLRFYFALTLFLLGIKFYLKKNFFLCTTLILLSFLTHFSLLVFSWVPVILILKPRITRLNIIYLFSLVFLFIPTNDIIINLLENIQVDAIAFEKVFGYLENEDHFLRDLSKGNLFNKIQIYYRLAIVVVFNLSYFWFRKKNSKFLSLFLVQLILTNLLFSIPVIYLRFSIFTFYLLIALLITLDIKVFHKRIYLAYFCIYFIMFFLVFKENILETFMNFEFFFTPSIFFSSPDINYLN